MSKRDRSEENDSLGENDSFERNVRFRENFYGEPVGRTVSGQVYFQDPKILRERDAAKANNPNVMVLNHKLAAKPPIINGVPDPLWTTNDSDLYQPYGETKANREEEWKSLTEQQKQSRLNRREVNRATLKKYKGGKIAKKTKRKISRRSKKSRRHRKK